MMIAGVAGVAGRSPSADVPGEPGITLSAVPGVLAARRFRATSANRRYVALYHLVSPDVQATPAWKSAADSEWTRRMRPHFRDHLRLVCKKYVRGG